MADPSNAIPTKYQGIQFRSRLEARWAAFFDLVGWAWRYEPLDLGGYIPDFIVEHGLTQLPLAGGTRSVDWIVTPSVAHRLRSTVRRLVEVKPEIDHADLIQHGAKIDASGWPGPAAIVGAAPGRGAEKSEGFELGVIRYNQEISPQWWRNWGGPWVMAPRSTAMSAWTVAGNRVQWRGVEAEPEPTVDPGAG